MQTIGGCTQSTHSKQRELPLIYLFVTLEPQLSGLYYSPSEWLVHFTFHQLISLEMAFQTHLASDSQVIAIPRKVMEHTIIACFFGMLY